MSDRTPSPPYRPRRPADQDPDEIEIAPVVVEVEPAAFVAPTPGEHAVSPVRARLRMRGGVTVTDRRARG